MMDHTETFQPLALYKQILEKLSLRPVNIFLNLTFLQRAWPGLLVIN